MNHWMINAAIRGKLPGADALVIPPNASLTETWETVSRALGLTQDELTTRLAAVLRVKVADLEHAQAQSLRLLPEPLARKYHVFPIRDDDRSITVAVADSGDVELEQMLGFATGRRVVFELAPPGAITEAQNGAFSPDRAIEAILGSLNADATLDATVVENDGDASTLALSTRDADSTPVVKLTNYIIREAVVSGASDVHIEPGPKGGAVRFRIDGVMRSRLTLPMLALGRVVSRIKVVSKLDIADRLRPQDGRARAIVEGRPYDLRVSTVPTREAEKVVIRVMRADGTKTLDDSGLAPPTRDRLRQLLAFREGIVVVTGPTGSGKTTTLYAALREVATGAVNIMTVEDPVEYEMAGITQMQADPKRGVTFASALRAILRQDPDVIFVGEIRDLETAQVAVQAALTGHLVLATLHTNDAMGAVARLQDLGLDRPSIAASLRGSYAQRLLRRVCATCAIRITGALTEKESRLAEAFGVQPVVRAVGCPACANTGYRGRIPVAEVAMVTPAIAEQIVANASAAALQHAAMNAGMQPLHDAALDSARDGATTLEEVERVLGMRSAGARAPLAEATSPAAPDSPRILVVDDDPDTLFLHAAILSDAGYTVACATDGLEALRRLGAGEEFSLVLTDFNMPGADGRELVQAIRRLDATAALPVIVATAAGGGETELALFDAGADDYLQKPVDAHRLVARVRAALRRAAL